MKITFSLSVSFPKMISSSLSLPPHHWGIPVMAFLRNSLRFHYFKIFIVWALWCRIVILIVDGVISFIYAPMNPIVAFLSFKRFPSCCLILVFIKKAVWMKLNRKYFQCPILYMNDWWFFSHFRCDSKASVDSKYAWLIKHYYCFADNIILKFFFPWLWYFWDIRCMRYIFYTL